MMPTPDRSLLPHPTTQPQPVHHHPCPSLGLPSSALAGRRGHAGRARPTPRGGTTRRERVRGTDGDREGRESGSNHGCAVQRWWAVSAQHVIVRVNKWVSICLKKKTQGNLLAAYQEIKMIKMIGKNSFKVFIENSSEFDIFNLCNSLVSEKIDLSIEIINNLKSQKGSEALIIWGIFRELERLSILKEDSQAKLNGPFDYLENLSRKSKKINFNDLDDLKKKTALLDRNFKKGQGNFWFDLENLIIEFCQPKFH